MKNAYQILYGMSVVLLFMVILGGSLTKPVFNNFSTRTLETAGVQKSSIDSIDSKIDNMLYAVNRIQLQIEKLKNIFGDKEIDANKYQKVKNEMFARNIYNPLNELVIVFYRIGFFFVSVILFMAGVIFHLAYRSTDLRRRVSKLEKAMEQNQIIASDNI
jgi:regulator of replication initiation timing